MLSFCNLDGRLTTFPVSCVKALMVILFSWLCGSDVGKVLAVIYNTDTYDNKYMFILDTATFFNLEFR